MRYRVEETLPLEHEAELCALWSRNLPVRGDVAARFRWLYANAPQPSSVFVLRQACDDPAPILGCASVLARRFRIDGEDAPAALLGDLAVERAHRTVLPALLLVRSAREHARRSAALAYGFPSEAAEGVLARAGYRRLGVMVRHARLLRHGPFLERLARYAGAPPTLARLARSRRLAAFAGRPLDVARDLWSSPALLRARLRFELRWPVAVDERYDALWLRARDAYPVVGERGAQFLRWRFGDEPALRFAVLHARRSGEAVAYAVVEAARPSTVTAAEPSCSAPVAYLRDVFGVPEALGPLLELLARAMRVRGFGALSVRHGGGAILTRALEGAGFRAVASERAVYFDAGERSRVAVEWLADRARWHLLDADEDA